MAGRADTDRSGAGHSDNGVVCLRSQGTGKARRTRGVFGIVGDKATNFPTYILELFYTLPVDVRDTIMTNPDKVPTGLYQLVSASNMVFGGVAFVN